MLLIFILIFLYIITLLITTVKNDMRIWCSWCSIADFSSACTGSSPVIRCLNVYSIAFIGMFGRIVLWLLIMVVSGAMIYFSADLVEKLWRSRWAEEKIWWTREMWMLIWFLWVVIGWLVIFWVVWFSNPENLGTI